MTATRRLTCQVVPTIASFAVDDGFRYRIPAGLDVRVGHRVRVRVGSRRLRGFVTAVFDDPGDPERDLVELDGIVGTLPSFDGEDLDLLRWCASHYVGPVSVILSRTVPPNAPRSARSAPERRRGEGYALRAVSSGSPHVDAVGELLDRRPEGATMILAPSVAEVEALAEGIADEVVVAHSSLSAREVTASWVAAATRPGVILVGTREVALWPMSDLGSIVVVEDGRRAMRSPSTPTLGVREIALQRGKSRGLPVSFVAPVPSLEVIRRQPAIVAGPGRAWPLVEIADRNEEPPAGSVVLERTRRAITAASTAGEVFVLVPRRGYAAAFRCASCGAIRRCGACGSAVTGTEACLRCGTPAGACSTCGGASWRPLGAGIGVVVDDLRRTLGEGVGSPTAGAQVTVGTERDLVGRGALALAVAIDADGMSLAPNYRAAEHALRTLVRLAQTVERGRGRRALIQTSDATLPVVRTLVAGRPDGFLADELGSRRRSGFPPFTDLIALEVSALADGSRLADLAQRLGEDVTVRGPAIEADRHRWLLSGDDLGPAKLRLREIVGTLRDQGARVRVDVDPVDL